MGDLIIKLEGQYLIWSTISDRPESFGMTRNQLVAFVRREEGRRGVEALKNRLERVEAKGTSSYDDRDADDTMMFNRAAGVLVDREETPLHREEIIEFYIRRREEPTAESLMKFREGHPLCGRDCPAIVRDGCASHCSRCWGTGFIR